MPHSKKTAVIIGAGPAGLTAAYELLEHTDIKPLVFEAGKEMGGISKTIAYRGNRIDIGGHRFFSKSDRVMAWWLTMLPLEKTSNRKLTLHYQGKSRPLRSAGNGVNPQKTDEVMLVRHRLSRIYYDGKFFNYPVTLESSTIRNLGLYRMSKMGVSYLYARARPRAEKSLEDFYVNRFGRELYNTFFRDYTEKVWGVPCSEIAADWGAQRVKGLSISKAISHAAKRAVPGPRSSNIAQKDTETSLIEHFLYPKLGPGQMWEVVAKKVRQRGGKVLTQNVITKVHAKNGLIKAVTAMDTKTGKQRRVNGDYFISTMPVKDLIAALDGFKVPKNVREVSQGLPYRDFITVGLLMKRLAISSADNQPIADNWIYIQEPGVKVGRLQIFSNWSPYLVKHQDYIWIGLEYFVNEGDELWTKDDAAMAAFGIEELSKIGIIAPSDVLDSTVIRVKKTYPAYFGSYNRFSEVQAFTDKIPNLFLIGRNGMHRYNNQDHSMLTAMAAVENIRDGVTDKANLWSVNTEQDYGEEK